MATTIEQKPNLLCGVNSPMIFILKEDTPATYNGFKFRYVLKVEVNGTEIAVLKIHKNQQNVGVFDISHLVKSYVDTQLVNQNSTSKSIHSLGIVQTSDPFSLNSNQCAKVEVKAFYEKSTSAETSPEMSGQQAVTSTFIIPATTPFTKTASNVGGLDVNGTNMPLQFFMNSTAAEDSCSFFTNAPTVQFVRGSSTSADNLDQLTLCLKQGGTSEATSLINQGVGIAYIYIEYFDSTGTEINSGTDKRFANTSSNGGSTIVATTVEQSILYVGVGTKNLETQTLDSDAKPSNNSNWAYYRVYGTQSINKADRCTKYYYFYRYGASRTGIDDRHQSCTRYDNIRLAWRNRLGAWDYMNFRGKSTKTLSIKSSEMESVPGNWDSATEDTFSYNNWDRGKKTLFKTATRKIQINSDWLNEEEAVWLEELFTSDNVQILDDDYTIIYPVVLTEKSYTTKTSVNDGIKMQYTINLEYANKVKTNN
tara:strand:+ start:110 stop:1549 length:1440 start_codon:yes stop_codon:yes gene_type:complete